MSNNTEVNLNDLGKRENTGQTMQEKIKENRAKAHIFEQAQNKTVATGANPVGITPTQKPVQEDTNSILVYEDEYEDGSVKAKPYQNAGNTLPDSYKYVSDDEPSEVSRVSEGNMTIDMEDFKELEETKEPSEDIVINKEEIVTENTEEVPDAGSELAEEIDEEKKDEQDFVKLQKEIRKTVPLFNKVDLRNFAISDKPINYANTLPTEKLNIADWVLSAEDKMISMREWKGYELNDILIDDGSRSVFNRYNDIMKRIYNHITSPKPGSSEQWIKVTKYDVLDDIYFAIYKASYAGANHIAYKCPHCGKQFIIHDVPIESMVKYKDEAAKEHVEDILRSSTTGIVSDEVILKQISDEYAVTLRLPSIYDIAIQPTLLKSDFRQKYADVIENISYIDNIYYIGDGELRPIALKDYPGEPAKEIKEKIMKYATILNKLNSDQYMYFISLIRNLNKASGKVTYVLPGFTCPGCKKTVKEDETTAQQLLFTRHQLIALANMRLS